MTIATTPTKKRKQREVIALVKSVPTYGSENTYNHCKIYNIVTHSTQKDVVDLVECNNTDTVKSNSVPTNEKENFDTALATLDMDSVISQYYSNKKGIKGVKKTVKNPYLKKCN